MRPCGITCCMCINCVKLYVGVILKIRSLTHSWFHADNADNWSYSPCRLPVVCCWTSFLRLKVVLFSLCLDLGCSSQISPVGGCGVESDWSCVLHSSAPTVVSLSLKTCRLCCICCVAVVFVTCNVAAVLRNASVSPLRLFSIPAGCPSYQPSLCKCGIVRVCVCVCACMPTSVYAGV